MDKYYVVRFSRTDSRYTDEIKKWWGVKVGAQLSDMVFTDAGYMLAGERQLLAAAFLYPINGCHVALIGFPVANPSLSKEERQEALKVLTTTIELEAKKLNYKYLMSYAGSKGAVELFDRSGYQIYDTEVTNFGKAI